MERNVLDMNYENLFVSTTFAPDGSEVKQVVRELLRSGVSNIELGSTHRYDPDFLEQLSGLPCRFLIHNYFPIPKNSFVLNIASEDETIRTLSLKHIMGSIDFSAAIGAELYTFHPGFLTDPTGIGLKKANYDFLFRDDELGRAEYNRAYDRMLHGVERAAIYAEFKGVKIAIESEGSLRKKDHLLMQTPEEFVSLYRRFSPGDIGVTLNIGHLHLSSRAFRFKPDELLDAVGLALAGFEISHNQGLEDDHLPAQKDGWYWPLLLDRRFLGLPKILELRDTSLDVLLDNLRLCDDIFNSALWS